MNLRKLVHAVILMSALAVRASPVKGSLVPQFLERRNNLTAEESSLNSLNSPRRVASSAKVNPFHSLPNRPEDYQYTAIPLHGERLEKSLIAGFLYIVGLTMARDERPIPNQSYCVRDEGMLYTIKGEHDRNLIFKNGRDSLREMQSFYDDYPEPFVLGVEIIIHEGINTQGIARLEQDRDQPCEGHITLPAQENSFSISSKTS